MRTYFRALLLSTCLTVSTACSASLFAQVQTMEKEADLIGVLQNGAPADKAIACKRLAIYGTGESVSELAKLLPDDSLSSWTRIALEAIPGSKPDEALRNAAKSLSGNKLIGVLNSIGVRGDVAAVDLLKSKLQDSDVQVASAAAIALGQIGNEAARKSLTQSLANAPAGARSAIAEACVLCAEKAMNDGKSDIAIAVYDQVRKADVPSQRVIEATRGAILARKEQGVPLLVENLRSPDRGLFRIALATAREMTKGDVDGALSTEIGAASPDRAALVIQALADRNGPGALPAIVKAAASGPKEVRLSALNALARVGNASSVSTLVSVAGEADADLTKGALQALAELPDQNATKEILDRLSKADDKLLPVLLAVVGVRRIEATDLITKALAKKDKATREAALKALGATVPPDRMDVLLTQVLKPSFVEDVEVARSALKTAAVRMPDREACAKQIAASIETSSLETQTALLDILAAVGGTNALQAVKNAALSSSDPLKDVSSKLLGDWMTIDAAPVLLNLATSGPADKYQGRALRGYIRIARQFAMGEPERVAMIQNALMASKQPADQKLILPILEKFSSIEMLKIAIKMAGADDLKEDATKTVLAIAKKLDGKPEVAKLLAEAGIKP
ncbi:MAG: HEAT repeat domain-containing protein [Pirellula sp.]|nr:HEAT repeat domain-containing protein [Pirellula sp.]